MGQRRLFRPKPVVLHLHASYEDASGWSLVVISRREGESWDASERSIYEYMTTAELLQVACEELSRRSC